MELNKVTNNIKELRFKANNMSQQKLADLVGCTRQTIIAIEQNKYSPSLFLTAKIAHIFNVNIDDVIQIYFT